MLTLTENAATVIKGLTTRSDASENAGLRIGTLEANALEFDVQIAAAPESGDAVVESGGVRVFLDNEAITRLSDKELDATVDEEKVRFSLRNKS